MKLYIAGPMTGLPQFNFPAFDRAAASLRMAGHDTVSPAELDDEDDRAAALASPDGSALDYGNGVKATWGDFLARDVKLLTDGGIEGVVVLRGWQRSRGARLETFVASAMNGLPILEWDGTVSDLVHVAPIDLYRAWCGEPDLAIAHRWSQDTAWVNARGLG